MRDNDKQYPKGGTFRRSFRRSAPTPTQSVALGWYAVSRWDTGNRALMPTPPRGWESRVSPVADMHGPIGALIRPKGAFAYQTGVQPREQMARKPCVLKERRIGADR